MIEGITKPFRPENDQLTADEQRAAAAAFVAGIRDLFAQFDLEGDWNEFDIDAFLPGGEKEIGAAPNRDGSLRIMAPDGQDHTYTIEGTLEEPVAVRRLDEPIPDYLLGVPKEDRVRPFAGRTVEEWSAEIRRLAAEREALAAYETNSSPVDEEEIQKLFAVLMQGRSDLDEP